MADALEAGDAGQVPRLLGAALAAVPAVWVLVGVAALLFGVVPRAATAVWGALAACFLLGLLGPLLSLPDWLMAISPFEHVPRLPADDFALAPLLWLTGVAALLLAAGLAAFRRRDVPSAG